VPLPSLIVPSHRACAVRVGMRIPFERESNYVRTSTAKLVTLVASV
jgi:hypothetical protein